MIQYSHSDIFYPSGLHGGQGEISKTNKNRPPRADLTRLFISDRTSGGGGGGGRMLQPGQRGYVSRV